MVITLTPEIERALTEQADRQGTTPERLALESLREWFLGFGSRAVEEPAVGSRTLADALSGYVGVLHSSEHVPGGARLSEATGKKFSDLLLERHRERHE